MNSDHLCLRVQEVLASEDKLTERQQTHVDQCQACQLFAQHMLQLDEQVDAALSVIVPDDFADRVMAQVSDIKPNESDWPLIARLSKSSLWQGSLLVFGLMVGVSHITRFIFTFFITSMAAF